MAREPREPRRLLVLGAGAAQLGLLAAARDHGLFVIAADRDPAAIGFAFADRRALVSAEDEEGIDRLAEAEGVDGLIAPGIDWPVAVAARVAERRGLAHPLTAAQAVLATSKLKQRERFLEAGVPQPPWRLCRSAEEVRAAAAELGLPVVVKAPDRQGQRGLGLVRAEHELAAAAAEALGAARTGTAIVERYAPGREVTVNAFLRHGEFHPLTITDRHLADPPAFGVALAHVWPSALPAPVVEEACRTAHAAAEALGVRQGPVYVQVLAGDDGPQVIELAARLGGGHDAELCRAALGVDLNGLALAAALGEEIDDDALVPRPRAGGACVRFLVPPPGPLADVLGVEDALAL
ncbi:MAG: ATP-grasp domain-containing protein, partial [Pseudomonadota bacterium]